MKQEKISIIIPCYGTEKYVERCLDSLINQTYNNLEIIVVNDCSPGNMIEIIENYANIDKRIKIVNCEKNQGLFHARLSGAKIATGEYIAFVDSDDYVELDFYRELLETLRETNSDMVTCNTVIEDGDNQYVYNFFNINNTKLNKEQLLNEYFKQRGLNYRWHTVWNKLYKMSLWKKCEKYYYDIKKHLIMTEDFAFSTVLYYFANSLSYNNRANYYYCSNSDASTSLSKLTYTKCKKNITDIGTSFNFVENFMKKNNIYDKYLDDFNYWKSTYLKMWYDNTKNANFTKKEEKELLNIIFDIDSNVLNNDYTNKDIFYSITTKFNNKLVEIKNQIIENDVISFDIFDTLIYRPFYEPKDLFKFLNNKYIELTNDMGLLDFSTIRYDAEFRCREYSSKLIDKEEVTIEEIYEYINRFFNIDKKICDELQSYEKELEIRFCKKRETAHSLYKLALFLNKKIIITSDMYLDEKTIINILNNNDYHEYNTLYLSSTTKKTKHFGTIFKLIRENNKDKKILHIGDNWNSDVSMPNKYNINAALFPKTIDVFFNNCSEITNTNNSARLFENFENQSVDYSQYLDHLGVRTSLAVIANKFFDNPFISFNDWSDFNADALFIGYYNLGMHMFSFTKWLLDDCKKNKYNTLSFMARDGYLPYKIAMVVNKIYDNEKLNLNYIHISRKSIFPITIKTFKDLYKIQEYFKIENTTPKEILEILEPIINLPKDYDIIIANEDISLNEPIKDITKYNKLLNIIWNKFYNINKFTSYSKLVKEYFEQYLLGKSSVFDIGYSAQPELILTNLLEKSIDTYFIHENSDSAFNKSNIKNNSFAVKSFYDYKPTFTGTLREYIISDFEASCVGYELEGNDNVIPKFGKKESYSYFDKEILNAIHEGSISFASDMCDIFGKDIFNMEFPKYYMSAPFEYYLHHSKINDRKIFCDLIFDQNVGDKIKIIDYWDQRINDYNIWFNKNISYKKWKELYYYSDSYKYDEFLNERVNNRNIFIKVLFYILYDKPAIRVLIGRKLKYKGLLYRILKKLNKK